MAMPVRIREFAMSDYNEVRGLWKKSGLEIRPGDDAEGIRAKLEKDPDLFLVAEEGGKIVGSVMGAWDGRRGWLYHLGVLPGHRRRGIATKLVREVEKRMRRKGVVKVNALIYETNRPSLAFFLIMGYTADRSTVFHGKKLRAQPKGISLHKHPWRKRKSIASRALT